MSWFCPAPWKLIHIHPSSSIKPCCIYNGSLGSIEDIDLESVFAGKEISNLRDQFRAGEIPEGCLKCYEKEKMNVKSYREILVEDFGDGFNKELEPSLDSIEWLDLSFSNSCNMSCRFCGPYCSTKWINEVDLLPASEDGFWDVYKKYSWKKFDIDSKNLNSIIENAKNLKVIEIKGGEPFLSSDHITFLKALVSKGRASDIELRYTTNGSVLNKEYIPLLNEFKDVSVTLSMEGVGDIFSYLRGNLASEQQVEKAISFFRQIQDINLSIHFLLCAYNIFAPSDFYSWFKRLERNDEIELSIGTVVDPSVLNLRLLPLSFRKKAIIDESDAEDDFAKEINSLLVSDENEDGLDGFWRFVNELDRIHNTSLIDVQPEFKELL